MTYLPHCNVSFINKEAVVLCSALVPPCENKAWLLTYILSSIYYVQGAILGTGDTANENPGPGGVSIPVGETDSKQDKYTKYAAYQMVCAVRETKQVGGVRGTGMGSNSNRGAGRPH